MKIGSGYALPYGTSQQGKGWNFAFYTRSAQRVVLAFFEEGKKTPIKRLSLTAPFHKTGQIWHCYVEDIDPNWRYGYFIDGPQHPPFDFNFSLPLLDPYAIAVDGVSGLGILPNDPPFDWSNDVYLNTPLEESIIYEMHVRGFTQDSSSKVASPGTFKGVIEKIPYLKSLGITAVELMPVHFYDPTASFHNHPKTHEPLGNYWGYSTLNFFSLAPHFATAKANIEFKEMVLQLHQAGIEVILDVVFNHTGERFDDSFARSFRGIARPTYYMLNDKGDDMNYSGCGNTFNCNHPIVRELIRASLRHFACQLHVDGFRFDLASILGRDQQGNPLHNPPLIEMIAGDPLLADKKLIAEAWDAAGLYQVGTFAQWGKWSEWNGKFRDRVRAFIKGDGEVGDFVSRFCGSHDIYYRGHPGNSINFLTAHDGFTLYDLVSYNDKHNEENGENNQDGCNDNRSWNCGAEGPTDDPRILALRERQMKNLLVALLTSQGACMLQMGDEYGHTRRGNNNAWCQDNDLNWFLWNECEKQSLRLNFTQKLIQFRRQHPILMQRSFLSSDRVHWHGLVPYQPNWNWDSHFIACTLVDTTQHLDLYIAFNASHEEVDATLPDGTWDKVVDTNAEPYIFWPGPLPIVANQYRMAPYSSIILKRLHER